MMKKSLILIRGLPSSGKSTLAWQELLNVPQSFEADDYFYVDEEYKFDPTKLADAHKDCQERVMKAMKTGDENIIVSNTFTQRWEMQPYINLAEKFGWKLVVIDLFDGGCDDAELHERNVHDVPLKTFAHMRKNYEHSWSTGNPIPPWERESKE